MASFLLAFNMDSPMVYTFPAPMVVYNITFSSVFNNVVFDFFKGRHVLASTPFLIGLLLNGWNG